MTATHGTAVWHRDEVADGLAEALEGLMASVEENDGFPRWNRPTWRRLAADGWFELLVGFEEPDRVKSARMLRGRLGAISEFERFRVPGPVASTVGFVLPLLSASSADDTSVRLLEEMTGDGRLVVHASAWRDSFGSADRGSRRPELRDRSGGSTLSGSVHGVPCAQLADVLLVPVTRADGRVAVLALEPGRAGVDVESCGSLDSRLEYGRVTFENVEIAERDFVGGCDADLGALVARLDAWYLVALSALASGGGDALIARTRDYVVDRRQFGVPVGTFQAVKHMIAEMYRLNENGRAFTVSAAEALLSGEAAWMDDVVGSRLYTGRGYVEIGELAMQCHGGFGYTWEQQIHFWYRSALDGLARPHAESQLVEALADRIGLT